MVYTPPHCVFVLSAHPTKLVQNSTLILGYAVGVSLLHLGEGNALWAALAGLLIGFLPALQYNRSLTRRKGPEFRVLRRLT